MAINMIRVAVSDPELIHQALERLRGLGVYVTTGEADSTETVAHYLSRINSQLDNLGNLSPIAKLRHAGEAVQQYLKVRTFQDGEHFSQFRTRQRHQEEYFRRLAEANHKEYKPSDIKRAGYLTDAQIEREVEWLP